MFQTTLYWPLFKNVMFATQVSGTSGPRGWAHSQLKLKFFRQNWEHWVECKCNDWTFMSVVILVQLAAALQKAPGMSLPAPLPTSSLPEGEKNCSFNQTHERDLYFFSTRVWTKLEYKKLTSDKQKYQSELRSNGVGRVIKSPWLFPILRLY